MKRLSCICFLLLFASGRLHSQVLVSGRVVDSETDRPVAWATIFAPAESAGTVTNEEGDFVLKLSDEASSVRISCIGYGTVEKKLSSGETVALAPVCFDVGTVVVTPLDVGYILKNVQKSYFENTPPERTNYYANIRQFQIFDGRYVQAIDMIGNVSIPGSRSLNKLSQYKVSAVGASLFQEADDDRITYSIRPILNGNSVPMTIVRYMRKHLADFDFNLTRFEQDGGMVYKIDFDNSQRNPRNKYSGTLFIDAATYAIVWIRFAQDKSAFPAGTVEYNGAQVPFRWDIAEVEAGFSKIGGLYRTNYMLARDSFSIGGHRGSVNYSFVYSASGDGGTESGYDIVLDEDLYSQLKKSNLKSNTDFNSILPTGREGEFFKY